MRASSYKSAFVALVVLLCAFFAPMLLRGHVVYPHDNGLELGVASGEPSEHRSNRKFSDQSSVYVPEIHHHLNGDHESWLSTWNPHVELGRPSIQVAGFGPSSPIARVLGWFTSDEFVMATWLAISAVVLIACFCFLFLRALDLHAWACFAASAGVSIGPFAIHYLNVVQLLSGVAWTFALLWLITRFIQRPAFAHGAGIAFATYLLFITAYPQQIVWHAYLIVAYTLVRLVTSEGTLRIKSKTAGVMFVAALCGVALSAPIYLDLAIQARQSARLDTEPEFFLVRLPTIRGADDVLRYFAKVFDALWQGNPITIEDQDVFNGLCFTPFFVAVFLVSWMSGVWRRSWLWLAFGLLTFVLTVWHAAYIFGVDHLGLHLSRFVPLRAGVIPWAVAGAMTIDHVLRAPLRPRVVAIAIAVCPLALVLYGHGDWRYFGASIAFVAVTIAFLLHRHVAWLVILVVGTVFYYGQAMLITRPETDIHVTSPLVEKIRELSTGGTRYACVGNEPPRLLPPNQEVQLGLRSIHSYNSLSSLAYQEWVLRLSEKGTRTYGRQFKRIASAARLDSEDLAYSGLGVFVSARRLDSARLASAGEVDGMRLYRSTLPPMLEAQISQFDLVDAEGARITEPIAAVRGSGVRRTLSRDDHLRFELRPSAAHTLLFVSQQYHPQWKASADGAALATVEIDGFYQGVVVPAGTKAVELRYRPFVLWSWIPQLLLLVFALALGWRVVRSRHLPESSPR
jgi:hypothetical protein